MGHTGIVRRVVSAVFVIVVNIYLIRTNGKLILTLLFYDPFQRENLLL